MNDEQLVEITEAVAAKFRSFGGGRCHSDNPISIALQDSPPMFAGGVDIAEVVKFVVAKCESYSKIRTELEG